MGVEKSKKKKNLEEGNKAGGLNFLDIESYKATATKGVRIVQRQGNQQNRIKSP